MIGGTQEMKSPEIYRINLEQGRFLSPFVADSVAINTCSVNPVHQLLAAGTIEGRVECWDPRTRRKAGVLDCALSSITSQTQVKGVPAVTSLAFNGAMRMAVGTSTGQILLYDIRSNKPTLVKDHRNGLAIRSLEFSPATEMVVSSDSRAVKIWNQSDGKPYVTVEAEHDFNDVCLVPNSGLMLMACEAPKLLSYFIPVRIYLVCGEGKDDEGFGVRLCLSHLIGTSLLRAYMHGYFIDIRLYHKAKSIADPFAYQEYRKNKITEKIEEQRTSRVKVKKLPSVNAALAEKLQEEQLSEKAKKAKKEGAANILSDDRFSALFKNPDYQVDEQSEEFRLVQPLVNKQSKKREKPAIVEQFEELDPQDEEMEGHASSDGDSSSDEDDRSWQEELRRQHFALRQEKKMKREAARDSQTSGPKFYELKSGEEFSMASKKTDGAMKRLKKASLAERVEKEADFLRKSSSSLGNQQISFKSVKNEKNRKRREAAVEHHKERRKLRRSAGNLSKKKHHRTATS
nr:nucleolar protein 10-like [Lytechinus pictus]